MTEWLNMADELGPEKILHVYDPSVGMKGVVVVDTTSSQGWSGGGTRMLPDITTEEIKWLARTMTYKLAYLDMPVGGAKAGIWADASIQGTSREAILRAFGNAVRQLLTTGVGLGADMGTTAEDVAIIYEGAGVSQTSTGLARQEKNGEPLEDHITGYGVMVAAEAACGFAGIELKRATVAIEGFGKVGGGVARYMAEAGAKIVAISTIGGTIYNPGGLDIEKLLSMRKQSGDRAVEEYEDARHIDKEEIYSLPVDVLIPGARPYVIYKNNVMQIQAKVISSIANIPITDEAEEILFQRGIYSVPDFISNAGGVVLGVVDALGGTPDDAFRAVRRILDPLVHDILADARKEMRNPRSLAVRRAKEKVLKARTEKEAVPSIEKMLELVKDRLKM